MKKETFYFMNLTPMHVATGEVSPLDDSIKGAIQRHPITNVPIIPSSSFKGALRSHLVLNGLSDIDKYNFFGKESDEKGGNVGFFNFSDLHIIAQPINVIEKINNTFNYKTVYLMSQKYNKDISNNKVEYTIFDIKIEGHITKITNIKNPSLKKRLEANPYDIEDIFFVNPQIFNILTEQNIWVRSRTALYSPSGNKNNEDIVENKDEDNNSEYSQRLKKQVANGCLWKDEFVIEGAVWESVIITKERQVDNIEILFKYENTSFSFYVGGLETIGCGLMEILK